MADGPERFRDAYRRIVDICRAEGATGITWFFHVDLDGNPDAPWNRIGEYYPGDAWLDWLGVSDYGLLKPGWSAPDFVSKLDRGYDAVSALSPTKPIAVLEYGYAERRDPRAKARWIARAMRAVATGQWPRIAALSYWYEEWQNGDGTRSDLHIDSSKLALRAYRHGAARRAFASAPVFASRP